MSALAVLGGALLLMWPAFANGYPITFSDTAGLAAMGIEPNMGWDKPWAYGPLILLFHWRMSLWGVALAQALLTSATLWAVCRATGRGLAAFAAVLAVLAGGSAAPWFVPFVMPDIFAPLTVLGLFLLGWHKRGSAPRPGRGPLLKAGASPSPLANRIRCQEDDCPLVGVRGQSPRPFLPLATIAIAVHLAHLVIASACLLPVLLLRPRRLLLAIAPLLLALAWLFATNWIGNGIPGISPYGSVFMLARLQQDGPATDLVRRLCPAEPLRICAWRDQLPMDSDAFLWSPDGPVWGNHSGPIAFAPEAARLVAATLRAEPLAVARAMARNTLAQLGQTALGDTLSSIYLADTVHLLLATYFPPAELARLESSRQYRDQLAPLAAPLAPLRQALLVLGAAATLCLIPLRWRRDPALAGLALMVLVGVLANAFATGALSHPHDRYGARIAWLLLLPPVLALLPRIDATPPQSPQTHTGGRSRQ